MKKNRNFFRFFNIKYYFFIRCFFSLKKNNYHIDLERASTLAGYAQCFACFTTSLSEEAGGISPVLAFERELATIQREVDRNKDLISIAYSPAQIRANQNAGKMSAILTLEGTAGFGHDPELLEDLHSKGMSFLEMKDLKDWDRFRKWVRAKGLLNIKYVDGGYLADIFNAGKEAGTQNSTFWESEWEKLKAILPGKKGKRPKTKKNVKQDKKRLCTAHKRVFKFWYTH